MSNIAQPKKQIEAQPWAWLAIIIFTGLNTLNYMDRSIMPAVLSDMTGSLKLVDNGTGWCLAAFMIGYFIAAPICGFLGDLFPRKYLMLGGVIIWSCATALTSFAQGFYDLFAIRVFVGVGEACFVMICPAWISDLYAARWRNLALTVFYTAVPVGSAIGYFFGAQFTKFDNHELWRLAFLFAGAPGVVLALFLLFLKEPAKGACDDPDDLALAVPHENGESSLISIFRLIISPRFIFLTAGYTMVVFAIGAFQGWGTTFLIRSHYMTSVNAGTAFGTLLIVTGLLATVVGGLIASILRTFTSRGYAILLAGSVIPTIPIALFAFFVSDSLLCLIALGMCMFLLFLPTAPANSQLYEFVTGQDRAKATGIMTFFLHLFGDLPSPILVGAIATHLDVVYSYGGRDSLQISLCILPVALFFGAIFWTILIFLTGPVKPRSQFARAV